MSAARMRFRDARTGHYTSKDEALANPGTTVGESAGEKATILVYLRNHGYAELADRIEAGEHLRKPV